ncbi:MAG: 50S ribosomal protein L1, partial [Actinomycetota bacterium]|nr:50S ribosomal protein L1 [Actinomycetota bacterium]
MGKRLLEQRQRIDTERLYTPREALELLKELEGAKFDESVEAHVRLNVDPRRADQMVRGTLMLPNGTGKTRRVAVFAVGENAREAEEAGADIVGSDDLAA